MVIETAIKKILDFQFVSNIGLIHLSRIGITEKGQDALLKVALHVWRLVLWHTTKLPQIHLVIEDAHRVLVLDVLDCLSILYSIEAVYL